MIPASLRQTTRARGPLPFGNLPGRAPRTLRSPQRREGDRARRSGRCAQAAYVCFDALLVFLNASLIFRLRFEPFWLSELIWRRQAEPLVSPSRISDQYLAFLFLYIVLMVLSLASQNLYRSVQTRSSLDESLSVLKACLLATWLLVTFIYLSKVETISRLVVCATGLLNILVLAAWRVGKRRVIKRWLAAEEGTRNVLIVGAGKVGQQLARYLAAHKEFGFVVKGFLDSNHSGNPHVLGRIEDLARLARAYFVDEVFITIPSEREVVRSVALEARRHRLDVRLVPELYGGLAWRAPLEYVGDFPLMTLYREPIPALGLVAKRMMDVVLSAAGLLLLSPSLAAIAIAIKLDSRGPVFYRALRVGRKGQRFLCYKFRSMVADADALKNRLRSLNERCGPTFKISNDPRITRLGRVLRKYSLDELPQLWNVLMGDMSLVGPRPHPTDDCAQYQPEHLRRLDVTPGLTGLWQVSARRDPSFDRNMALDLEYIENWNLWLDFKIVLRTVPILFQAAGE